MGSHAATEKRKNEIICYDRGIRASTFSAAHFRVCKMRLKMSRNPVVGFLCVVCTTRPDNGAFESVSFLILIKEHMSNVDCAATFGLVTAVFVPRRFLLLTFESAECV